MATNFYSSHYINISEEIPIQKQQLEKGMIAGFRYKNQRGENKKYLVIILNPQFYSEGEEKTYALTLSNFSVYILNNLAAKWGVIYSKKFQKLRVIDVPTLAITGNPKSFYHSQIKPFIEQKGTLNYSYRIFFRNQLGRIFAANYKFKPSIMEGLKEEKVEKK